MRPFLDHDAEAMDEGGSSRHSTWPTLSRRRHPDGEWDDYIMLYANDFERPEVEPCEVETYICSLCQHVSPNVRGLSVHLSRKHDIKSARADYYHERNRHDH